MKTEHKKANEHFFNKVLLSLNKGGQYSWIEKLHIFSKFDNKLYAHTEKGYLDIKEIVTTEYFNKTIRQLNNKL